MNTLTRPQQDRRTTYSRYRGNRRSGGRGRGRGTLQNQKVNAQLRGNESSVIMLHHPSECPSRDQFVIFKQELEQYILKNFTYPDDIVCVIKDMKDPTKEIMKQIPRKTKLLREFGALPNMTDDELDEIKEAVTDLYTQDMKLYTTRKQSLRQNMVKLYGIIWGNCTHALQTKIAAVVDYEEKSKEYDCLWLV